MSDNLCVCILMATYNGDKYLVEQLESIRNQSYTNWQLIIHDDGSPDNTMNIIKKYTQIDKRIFLLNDNMIFNSACDNFLHLIKHAHKNIFYKYLMFSDQDDIWKPFKIEETLQTIIDLDNNKNIPLLVHTDLEIVSENLELIDRSMLKSQRLLEEIADNECDICVQNIVTGCTAMVNDKLIELSIINSNQYVIMHDWWLAILAVKNGKIKLLNKSTILYRQHSSNEVGYKNIKTFSYIFNRILQLHKVILQFLKVLQMAKAANIKCNGFELFFRKLVILKKRFFK